MLSVYVEPKHVEDFPADRGQWRTGAVECTAAPARKDLSIRAISTGVTRNIPWKANGIERRSKSGESCERVATSSEK